MTGGLPADLHDGRCGLTENQSPGELVEGIAQSLPEVRVLLGRLLMGVEEPLIDRSCGPLAHDDFPGQSVLSALRCEVSWVPDDINLLAPAVPVRAKHTSA